MLSSVRAVHDACSVLVLLAAALLACILPSPAPAADLGPVGAPGVALPGKFVWFELVTDDMPTAQGFYRAVFGWTFSAVPGAPDAYTLAENAGEKVAGLFRHAPPPGVARSARWLTLVSVPDVAAAARYATAHGGAVVSPPATVAGSGTRALLRDPGGAVFGVLRAPQGDPPDTPVPDGEFFWADLLTRDPPAAAQFYQGLAGYEVSQRESDLGFTRLVLQSQGYARAGIVPLPQPVKQEGWLPYVLVSDVPGTLARVKAAGGKVLVEPEARLLDGNVAVLADPLGGVLGIVNWDAAPRDDVERAR